MKTLKSKRIGQTHSHQHIFRNMYIPKVSRFISLFMKESTIDGLKYVTSRRLRVFERVLWGLLVSIIFGFSIHSTWQVWKKLRDSPVIISFQPRKTKISSVPFPAITVCNVNLLKTSILTEKYRKVLKDVNEARIPLLYNGTAVNVSDEVMRGAVDMDHLSQFCLAVQNFRRATGDSLIDANGQPDFLEYVHESLTKFNGTYKRQAERMKQHSRSRLESVFADTAMTCEEMIVRCYWAGSLLDCGEIFSRIDTPNGYCCVFNMVPKFILENMQEYSKSRSEWSRYSAKMISDWRKFVNGDSILGNGYFGTEYPKYQRAGGASHGLDILVNPMLNEYSTCVTNDGASFKIAAHSPVSLPSVLQYGTAVPHSSEIFVDVEADLVNTEEGTLDGVALEKRGCVLQSDPQSKLFHFSFYSEENCIQECVAGHTWNNCSCVPYYLPRNESFAACPAYKRQCVETVHGKISSNPNHYCENCLPPCTDVRHNLRISQFPIRDNIATFIYGTENNRKIVNHYPILHIFYGSDSIYAKQRTKLYDVQDLIADVGGVLGLTLGVSIISVLEFIYYFTLRAFLKLQSA